MKKEIEYFFKVLIKPKLLFLAQQTLIDGQRATNVTDCSVLLESDFNSGAWSKMSPEVE